MAGEWIDRTIRGPAAEFMTADEFGKLFGVSGDFVRGMVSDGILPPAVKLSKQTLLYSWEHAVFLSLRLRLSQNPTDLSAEGVKGKAVGKTADTG